MRVLRVLIDIGHPAHVHFFKNAIRMLNNNGAQVMVTSRFKEFATTLLDELGIEHTPLTRLKKGGLFSLGLELLRRNWALYKVIRRFKPDIMAAIGGVSIAQVGRLTGVPSLVFYDTENAKLQNAITYPFASRVLVPACYESWVPRKRHRRYAGYHELAYLHPNYFRADKTLAIANGIDPQRDNFFLRLVSWQANHDVGERGWTTQLAETVVAYLATQGQVLISSESPLPTSLLPYQYKGKLSDVHHVLAFCRMVIGESATMASEAAVLGVPALYIAHTGRGYTNEQETKYHLVTNVRVLNKDNILHAIKSGLEKPLSYYQTQRQQLLDNTIDVNRFIIDCIEHYPDAVGALNKQTN